MKVASKPSFPSWGAVPEKGDKALCSEDFAGDPAPAAGRDFRSNSEPASLDEPGRTPDCPGREGGPFKDGLSAGAERRGSCFTVTFSSLLDTMELCVDTLAGEDLAEVDTSESLSESSSIMVMDIT